MVASILLVYPRSVNSRRYTIGLNRNIRERLNYNLIRKALNYKLYAFIVKYDVKITASFI